jgi:hypothetical protein
MAKMALTTDFKIPKLNVANYRDWTFNMHLYLESLDLFGHADQLMVQLKFPPKTRLNR